ncbi:MAG: hypothetical protein V3T29_04355 [Alphaproteobacteria bacterium]
MIILHRGKEASARVRRIVAGAEGAVFERQPGVALEHCVPLIAEWLANTPDPALIVVDAARADSRRAFDALSSLGRIAKYAGVDLHLVGGARLEAIADRVVKGDIGDTGSAPGAPAAAGPAAEDPPMIPFRRAQMGVPTWQEVMIVDRCSEAQARQRVAELEGHVVWVNNLYQVNVEYSDDLNFVHLIIRRLDREPGHNWRHFQTIKNELVGPDCEAVELYPSEKHLVDAKDHYHLWAYTSPHNSFGIGFKHGREVRRQSR